MAEVISIHIAPGSRLPMKSVESVVAEAGKGLVGDRYHGTRHRHVTVQSRESLDKAAEILGHQIATEGTRRNITVSDGQIPRTPGLHFRINQVLLEVVRVAAPCRLLDDEIAPGAARALHNKAGTVCRILEGGEIRLGDVFEVVREQ